jgi:hypothetical protein
MMSTDTIDELLIEAAQLAGWLYVEATLEGSSWQVLMDDAPDGVAIELDAPRKVLTLSAEIGAPAVAEQDKAAFHELVLRYNHHAHTTGGLCLALMPDTSGSFSLMRDIAASDLTAQELTDYMADFTQKILAWRDLMEQTPIPGDTPAAAPWHLLSGMRA